MRIGIGTDAVIAFDRVRTPQGRSPRTGPISPRPHPVRSSRRVRSSRYRESRVVRDDDAQLPIPALVSATMLGPVQWPQASRPNVAARSARGVSARPKLGASQREVGAPCQSSQAVTTAPLIHLGKAATSRMEGLPGLDLGRRRQAQRPSRARRRREGEPRPIHKMAVGHG